MIHIRLPQAKVEQLEEVFRSTADRKLRDRVQIVLLAQRGRRHQDIAADLCIHRRGVQRWLNAYLERGLDGLRPRKARGADGNIPAEMADEIKRWVIEGPAKQGLDRANWTHAELADHLLKTHGIRTSRSAMHRFCSRVGIRPYRPTYRFLRGNPDKQAQAREDIEALKKGRRRANSSC
ncbi:MAG: helix-turn-helix domain-containing protein [Gemmataceae bacterium]